MSGNLLIMLIERNFGSLGQRQKGTIKFPKIPNCMKSPEESQVIISASLKLPFRNPDCAFEMSTHTAVNVRYQKKKDSFANIFIFF